ncbi:hypothetical protein [Paenibacillus sp. IITD108]|uniref:hypothetical protein n=1 Tax=Paenibacillus sp. IITD108 TaxID=3116649 RepID=UPI002F41F2FD
MKNININFTYGEPLQIWLHGEEEPCVPAHFVEHTCQEGIEMLHVNWEGRFIELELERVRKISALDISTFKGASSANLNVLPISVTHAR